MGGSLTSLAGMLVQALKLHSTFPALGWLVLNRLAFGWWATLEDASQVALIVLLALFIGYMLDSLNFILLGQFESIRIRFAWSDHHRRLLRLGDELADGKERIKLRYGIEAVELLWPHMMAVLSENGYAAQVEREKANLDFFLNLFTLSLLFLLECLVAHILGWRGSTLLPWATLGMVYISYRLAISSAIKWYDWINAAFDLYRYQLAEQLALEPFRSKGDETRIWRAFSDFIQDEKSGDFLAFNYPLPRMEKAETETESDPPSSEITEGK